MNELKHTENLSDTLAEIRRLVEESNVPAARNILSSVSTPQGVSADLDNWRRALALVLLNTCEDRNGIEISVRFVNRETSEIMTVINVETMDVYYDRKDSSGLKKMAEKLAEKITREFPMIQARLTGNFRQNILFAA